MKLPLTAQNKEQKRLTRRVHQIAAEVGLATVRHWTKAEMLAKWPDDGRYDTSTVRRDACAVAIFPKVRKWHD